MRHLLRVLVLSLAIAGCSDDDGDQEAAGRTTTTTTSTTTTAEACAGEPETPRAVDGSPASVVATVGDLRLAIVDQGASVEVVSLLRLDGCELRQVELGGQPAQFPVGGTVTHGDGIACADGQITVRSATSDDGETYQATTVTYTLRGDELVEVDRTASTITAGDDADTLQSYYELAC